jgi:flagellar basal-body rod modification protein FlgD
MQITSETPLTSAAAQQPAAAKISSDFDTFLRMLTTQLQNQDPLNPVDSSDYAVQLATFSSVEQQTLTNKLLGSFSDQLGLIGMGQLSGWVGNEARVASDVGLSGKTLELHFATQSGADSAALIVTNREGTQVGRLPVLPGSTTLDWQGESGTGTLLPDGRYSLTVESYKGSEKLGQSSVESYAEVIELRTSTGGNRLVLTGGIEVDMSDVTALRKPS